MRVLIIGGTRFIGLSVLWTLLKRGHQVALFNRNVSLSLLPPEVVRIVGNKSDIEAHRQAFEDFAPDVVFDNICMTEAEAERSMSSITGIAGRMVVVSSCDVYRAFGLLTGSEHGEAEPVPISEDSALRSKLYPYRQDAQRAMEHPQRWLDDYDKILVEQRIMQGPVPASVIRLPMVYGPFDGQHRAYSYLRRMQEGRPAILLDDDSAVWRNTRGYVENVAMAICLAIEQEASAGRIYNIAEQDGLSEEEWVRELAAVRGWQGRIVKGPASLVSPDETQRGGPLQDLIIDSSRIRQELGYSEPVSRQVALENTIEWQLANPPAQWPADNFDYEAEDRIIAELDGRG